MKTTETISMKPVGNSIIQLVKIIEGNEVKYRCDKVYFDENYKECCRVPGDFETPYFNRIIVTYNYLTA